MLEPSKKPLPQRGEVTSLKPLKPEQQPGDGLKTAKHHLNPGSNLAKKPSPAAWRSDKSETPKGEETSPST